MLPDLGKENFSSNLLGSVHGACELNRQIRDKQGKSHTDSNIVTCTGALQKRKTKRAVRLGAYVSF